MPGATPYVLVEERSVGGKQSKGKRIFRMALSIFTMVLCGLLFVHAILSLITTHTYPFSYPLEYGAKWGVDFRSASANFTIRVFSAYLLVISFLFLCVELKSTVVLTFFAGMISPLGRGIVYFINGLLVFGLVGNWGLVFGFFWMVCGVLHIALGARSCRTFYEEGTVDSGTTTVTSGLHTTHLLPPHTLCVLRSPFFFLLLTVTSDYEPATTSVSSGGEKNFCRSCGAALRPGDAYCPDCSAAV